MAEDIVVRLKAEAETAALQKYEAQLGKIADAAIKSGKSQADVFKQLQGIHAKTVLEAEKAGKTVGQYLTDVGSKAIKAADGMTRLGAEVKKTTAAHHAHGSAIAHVTRELSAMTAGYFAVHRIVHEVIDSFQEFAKFDTELRKMQNRTGASRAELDKLVETFRGLSRASGTSMDDLVGGFEELREHARLTLDQTKELFPAIVTGAQAAGTSTKVMADAFGAMMLNMNVGVQDATKVMDQLATAQAHLRLDMGQMLTMMPRLTESFGEMGYTGEQGTAAMLAWVSALRGVTKNSAEAGMAASRMMEQVTGTGMAHALRMPQRELERIVEHAKDEGQDVLSVVTGMLIQRSQMTGQTINQLLDKMSVRERRYWREAVQQREEVRKKHEELANAVDGQSQKMAEMFRHGPEKAVKDLSNAWTEFKKNLGETIASVGVTQALEMINELLTSIVTVSNVLRSGQLWRLDPTDKRNIDAEKKKMEALNHPNADPAYAPADPHGGHGSGSAPHGAARPPVPAWVPNAHKGTFYGGWSGWGGGAATGAQHFAGGGGFGGGGNTIEGRNWQHDLLSGSPMSNNIEDRRNTDATKANTEALKRLEDLLDDVQGVQGGLAGELGIGSIGGGRGMGGRFGGTSGGRAGGGGGGGGGVAGAGSGGPGTGMGDSTSGGSGMDGLPRGPAAGQAVYDKMLTAFKGSDLIGKVPPGGERFGFKTGSAEEWAKFGTGVAKAESNFNPSTTNPSDPGGSNGILQYAHNQVPGGNAFNVDKSIEAFVRDAGQGGVSRDSLLGRRFSTIGAHPDRTIRNMRDYSGTADGGGAAPPGGGGMVSHQGSGAMVPPELQQQMTYASAMAGVNTNIAHGMEPGHARHRPGAPAGDIDLHDPATGRKLDSSIPADREKMSQYITAAAASGAKGIGMGGPGEYMGASRMHVGGGTPAVWGDKGAGANTPGWVRAAYNKGIQNPVSPAQQQAAIAGAQGGTAVGFTGAASRGTPVSIASITSDASKSLTEAHGSAIEKATGKAANAAGSAADAGDDAGSATDRANAINRAQKAAGVDPSSGGGSPYGKGGFGRSGFGAKHQEGKLDSELDSASGKGRQRGFGGRHQASGKFDEELDSASGKKGRNHQTEGATGSPAGLPKQASFNLDKTQFSRRDRAMDKAAQTALHQASENSHADIGVA